MQHSNGPPGGGEGTNPASSFQNNIQRLQQLQAQQYSIMSSAQQQQQGGGGAGMQPGQPQLQQHAQMQPNSQAAQDMSINSQLAAARMMMMRQQQQQQQQQQASGSNLLGQQNLPAGGNAASVLGNWGGLQHLGGSVSSTLDASSGSSARLLAMSGMGMSHHHGSGAAPSSTSAAAQNIQALLQQKAAQQAQFPNQMGLSGAFQQQQMLGNTFSSPGMLGVGAALQGQQDVSSSAGTAQMTPQQLLFQHQLANLQKQLQLQQQQQGPAGGGIAAASALRNASVNLQGTPLAMQAASAAVSQQQNPQFARQQQLLQQLQQQQQLNSSSQSSGRMSPQALHQASHESDSNSALGMSQGLSQQRLSFLQQPPGQSTSRASSIDLGLQAGRGSFSESQLLLQQQSFLRATSTGQQGMEGDKLEAARQMFAQTQRQLSSSLSGSSFPAAQGLGPIDSSALGQHQMQQGLHRAESGVIEAPAPAVYSGPSRTLLQSATSAEKGSMQHDQQSFLDGNFAGGWQSNADLPDRRRIIFHILDVIKVMRPENSKMSSKLPHMAKSLEEHLYRSAQTKEQYLDMTTLKRRLQTIAHGLEVHRSSSSGSIGSQSSQGTNQALQNQAQQQSRPSLAPNPGSSNSAWALQPSIAQAALQSGIPQRSTFNGSMESTQNHTMTQLAVGGEIGADGSHSQSPADFFQSSILRSSQQDTPWSSSRSSSIESSQANQFRQTSFGNLMSQHAAAAATGHGGLTAGSGMQNGDNFSNLMTTQQQQFSSGILGQAMPQRLDGFASGSSAVTSDTQSGQGDQSKPEDQTAAQKKKVILQQQQRLLLLRHASKCTVGPACPTKFCAQMVTLWRHMKTCRDKHCRTSHCLSSRCVLNHYRICKSNGKTATCEVCGPVMSKIKQGELESTSTDPLARREREQAAASISIPSQLSSTLQESVQPENVPSQRIQARLENLQQLRRQQNQLLEQQRRLHEQAQLITDPTSQQAQQLQQQQVLLTQLQNRCQQQQLLLQKELHEQTGDDGLMIQSQQIQASRENHPFEGLRNHGLEPEETAYPVIQDTAGEAVLTEPATQGVEPARKRRNRSEGKGTPQSRRGSGIGKTMTVSQLAAVTDIQPKKRQGPSGSKELSQKKSKRTTSEANKLGDDSPRPGSGVLSSRPHPTIVACMTKEEISRHIESLNKKIWLSSRMVTHKCLPVIQELIDDQFGWVFVEAVDPVALGLPDYFDVVKNPMYLELVKKKLENAIYSDMEGFERDVKLVFENAILYNGEESEVGGLAQTMLVKFDKLYQEVVQGIATSHQRLESKGEVCSLCGSQKILFEPTVLYCQGKCGMQRIKRQATYFTDRTKQNHWCDECYEKLRPEDTVVLDDGNEILKKDLQEFKNDAVPEEGWVNCDECKTWVHQVCALFNGRTNSSSATFTCPNCYVHQLAPGQPPSNGMKGARELPETNLSRAIEKGLLTALEKEYESRAKELGCGVEEVEKARGLTVRVLSTLDKSHYVGDEMSQYYEDKGCATSFPVRTKCIALFQKIHGVDTLLFAVYVYEYGQNCPAPNKRRVYISYLDSVQYFEPKCYRTAAYHSVLIEYLRSVKARGFHTAHLWSCPPTPGDDYVFYCHPKHQKVPREDMLRGWYQKMLDKAKTLGIVIRATTLYDEYFKPDAIDVVPEHRFDATCLPYFEGDYIPGEIENIIRQVKARPVAEASTSTGAQQHDEVMARLGHNLLKMQGNFIVVHLRNRRFAAAVERGEDVSAWREDSDEELVRSKRAKISGKDSALSADPNLPHSEADTERPSIPSNTAPELNSDSILEANRRPEVGAPVEPDDATSSRHPVSDHETTEVSGLVVTVSATTFTSVSAGPLSHRDSSASNDETTCDAAPIVASGHATSSHKDSPADALPDSHDPSAGSNAPSNDAGSKDRASDSHLVADSPPSEPVTRISSPPPETSVTASNESQSLESKDTMTANEASIEPGRTNTSFPSAEGGLAPISSRSGEHSVDEMKKMVALHVGGYHLDGAIVADTTDDDDPFDSDLFESRQMFLNYCQTTHCQFDELRRAKHSSMMVLFQLHNPTAPKFLQQCGSCYLDITHGIRYHCNDCPDFDLCQDCYEPVTSGLWAKRDARFAHDKTHSFSAIDMERVTGPAPGREDRQNALKAHIDLLEHAGRCSGPPSCALQNCERMNGLFQHVRSCEVKPKKDCRICSRLLSLCAMHARNCSVRTGACPIPFCDRIRERYTRLRRQQQQMDDRRRRAQNELYRAGES